MIIGLVGFIGSGKDTAADYLVNCHGFRRDSFASSLKDAVAYVFGWDRTLLEGRTKQSREWREQVDPWWAERLKMPHLTPRWILQYWGTDVCRTGFHDDIWIASLENKLRQAQDNIVISDVRFPNEIKAIQKTNGKVFRINRGPLPDWYDYALSVNRGPRHIGWALSSDKMAKLKIHPSEWSWIGYKFDAELDNNGTIDSLFDQLKNLVQDRPVATDDPDA